MYIYNIYPIMSHHHIALYPHYSKQPRYVCGLNWVTIVAIIYL